MRREKTKKLSDGQKQAVCSAIGCTSS